MTGKKVVLWLVGGLLALAGLHFLAYPTITFNYRLTVEAMTPDGPKTGSTVIQVSYGSQFNMNGGGRSGDIAVTGEALYLDLGRGKNLFVLLSNLGSSRPITSWDHPLEGSQEAIYLPVYIYGFKWTWGDEGSLWRQVRNARSEGPRQVPLSALPTSVTFTDVSEPATVQEVDPRDIALTFGAGYVLSRATIELTRDEETKVIRKIIPWLDTYYNKKLDGQRYSSKNAVNPIANLLSSGAFDTKGAQK